MRILYLIQKQQLRGAEFFTCQLASRLKNDGHEVMVVSLLSGDASLPFEPIRVLNRSLHFRFLDLKGWFLLARLIKQFKPDIVQANSGDTLKFAVLSKIFFLWHHPIVFRNASTISRYIQSWPVRLFNSFLFRKVSFIISVSNHSMSDFLSLFPYTKNKIAVVPIGIDQQPIEPIKSEKKFLLHVGGFTFEKNHIGLLRIVDQVFKTNPDIELWLIGNGVLRKEIEQRASQSPWKDRIRFLGNQTNILAYMKTARALLLPSNIEGLPAVILEAMYCSTPVVAYDVGGVSELLAANVRGWQIDKNDERKFSSAIDEILNSDKVKLSGRIEQAHNYVMREFDNVAIAQRFAGLYARITKESA